MFSYWEHKHFFKHDLIVVGAGFVGLSTAIHFKRANPKASVLVLERGVFPTGASTKNAGFACFGSLTEILDDFWSMTQDEVVELVKRRYKGLQKIRKEFGDKTLGYKTKGGYELIDQDQLDAIEQIPEINKILKKTFEGPVFSKIAKYKQLGFSEEVLAVVKNSFEGELDPGKYLNAIWKLAGETGVKICTGVEVLEIEKNTGKLKATDHSQDRIFDFEAGQIAICSNAFTQQIWPESGVKPGRGLVMVSEPLGFKVPWKGCYHMDKGYVYFRMIEGRLLIGGARNKDFEGENTTAFSVNPKIQAHLIKLASEVIFPGKDLKWEREWTGIMGFGDTKAPIIQKVGDKTAAAVRLGGMGVALGWQVGNELSRLLKKGN